MNFKTIEGNVLFIMFQEEVKKDSLRFQKWRGNDCT